MKRCSLFLSVALFLFFSLVLPVFADEAGPQPDVIPEEPAQVIDGGEEDDIQADGDTAIPPDADANPGPDGSASSASTPTDPDSDAPDIAFSGDSDSVYEDIHAIRDSLELLIYGFIPLAVAVYSMVLFYHWFRRSFLFL